MTRTGLGQGPQLHRSRRQRGPLPLLFFTFLSVPRLSLPSPLDTKERGHTFPSLAARATTEDFPARSVPPFSPFSLPPAASKERPADGTGWQRSLFLFPVARACHLFQPLLQDRSLRINLAVFPFLPSFVSNPSFPLIIPPSPPPPSQCPVQ